MNAVKRCEIGVKRKNNEDAVYISDSENTLKNLYIVADGMGGHKAGEVASNSAIEAFCEYLKGHQNVTWSEENILDLIVEGIQFSNTSVFEKAISKEELAGMGTTFLVSVVYDGKLYIGHVGDCRLYLFRNGILSQITKDHSFVMELVKQGKMTLEEAAVHPGRNIITRALGTAERVEVDTIIENLEQNDLILMCSDGLITMVNDKNITEILNSESDLDQKADELVAQANENGGADNITVVLIQP